MSDARDPDETDPRPSEPLEDGVDAHLEAPYLIIIRGNTPTRLFKLAKVDTIIGRSGDGDITLPDTGISREHCLLTRLPNGDVRLRDLGSSNGTFHKGERITEVILVEGNKFQLGPNTVLKLSYEEILREE